MQKAAISARSGRRSGGCYASLKRAKADAKSDDFGAVWTQVRRLLECPDEFKHRIGGKHRCKPPQNRVGAVSQHSGRVGRRSYARFKAQIALENIQTFFGRV